MSVEYNQLYTQSALLVRHQAGEVKQSWPLSKKEMTIGRWPDNDVAIDDRWVSRYHARIVRQERCYLIEDLDSKNGTFVNGQRLEAPHELVDGDQIQVAPNCLFTFVDAEATAPIRPTGPGLHLDAQQRRAWVSGRQVQPPLSPSQFALLELLSGDPARVFSRDEIVAAVWPDVISEGVSTEAVDSLVRRLRQRLAELDPDNQYVVAVRGHGFRLVGPD